MRKVIFLLILLVLFFAGGVASAALVDNGDGTVTDTGSGLMWQKATAPGTYNWQEALSYCENLSLAGHSDWRLPNRNELHSLVDRPHYNPAIDPLLASNTVSSNYWSSTNSSFVRTFAWFVMFGAGVSRFDDKSGRCYVRAVRAGQSGSFDHLVISNISSPQSVAVPFSVTVTALNKYGGIDTAFNGSVTLSSLVPMSPATVKLTSGSWTGLVRLFTGGVNLTVSASGSGRSGTSNLFSTSGPFAAGNLAGKVRDNMGDPGTPLFGATVHLSATEGGPDAVATVQTDLLGNFLFQNVPVGQYYVWATYGIMSSSDPTPWSIPVGSPANVGTLTVQLPLSGTNIPVVLVPGILGSTDKSKGNTWWPRLKMEPGTLDSLMLIRLVTLAGVH